MKTKNPNKHFFPLTMVGLRLILFALVMLFQGHVYTMVSITSRDKNTFTIENQYLSRTLSIKNGILQTTQIVNKRADTKTHLQDTKEFSIRFSKELEVDAKIKKAQFITAHDCQVMSHRETNLADGGGKALIFTLKRKTRLFQTKFKIEVHYRLQADASYMKKHLVINTSSGSVALDRIDVEALTIEDAYQPYTIKQIYSLAANQWRPGLGQPLYATNTGLFIGIEFPAALNYVKNGILYSGYFWGQQLKKRVMKYKKFPEKSYTTYPSVLGTSTELKYLSDAFLEYIDKTRIRPLRLRRQYNSWFDDGSGVNRTRFAKNVNAVHQKLVVERDVKPLSVYVIDDGWQDVRKDWSKKAWPVNSKFRPDFASSFKVVKNAQSTLGIWISPGLNFGARPAVYKLRKAGVETLHRLVSLAGPKYMHLLEKRMLELTKLGIAYYKLDGLFGHLNHREFELAGYKYDLPYIDGSKVKALRLKPLDKRLNYYRYDELKLYYLVAGTQRLIDIFTKMHAINPKIYIVISNGAWLSAWWLRHVDAVWMINAGDAAEGSDRTQELVYRDKVYYDIWQKENTQYPMSSLFNHEPKKVKTGEPKEVFRRYMYMNMSRGTGFIELYIKTMKLSDSDWDVVAETLKWGHSYFPAFKTARMHGGNPQKNEVYGYAGFTAKKGYLSIHNPSKDKRQTYSIKLDRDLGVGMDGSAKKLIYKASSPLKGGALSRLHSTYATDSTITLTLAPKEIVLINFNR